MPQKIQNIHLENLNLKHGLYIFFDTSIGLTTRSTFLEGEKLLQKAVQF